MIRRALLFCVIAVLLWTSGALGVARGKSDIGSLLVICTGFEMTTIVIGPDGTPVERHERCPDSILAAMAALSLPEATLTFGSTFSVPLTRLAPANLHAKGTHLLSRARAPPVLI